MVAEDEAQGTRVCFSVDGPWLADFARTRFEEGAWERAVKMLTDSLEGLSTDQAIAIVKGEQTLTGDSNTGIGIKTTAKNSNVRKRMNAITERMYGRIFRWGDKYFEPYANVAGPWAEEDWKFASDRNSTQSFGLIMGSGKPTKGRDARYERRSMYYADDPAKDMLVIFETGKRHYEVLCRETKKTPPLWLNISTNEPETFLRTLDEKGMLEPTWTFEYRGAYEDPPTTNTAPKELIVEAPSLEDRQAETKAQVNKFINAINNATNESELNAAEKAFEDHMNKTRQGDIPNDQWTRIEEGRTRARLTVVEMYKKRILDQAAQHGGMIRLELKNRDDTPFSPHFVEVPKNPLILWALRGFRFEDFGRVRPEWSTVSYSGMKMIGDDPIHTDLIIGGGGDPWETYDRYGGDDKVLSFTAALNNAAWKVRSSIVEEWTGVEFSFLAKSTDEYMSGKVVHAKRGQPVPPGCIAICEDASPDYQQVLESINQGDKRGAIICQTGGKLAHMATVGREYDVMVLMVPDALKKYREDQLVFISLKDMKITVHM